jgi:hypothetical protein
MSDGWSRCSTSRLGDRPRSGHPRSATAVSSPTNQLEGSSPSGIRKRATAVRSLPRKTGDVEDLATRRCVAQPPPNPHSAHLRAIHATYPVLPELAPASSRSPTRRPRSTRRLVTSSLRSQCGEGSGAGGCWRKFVDEGGSGGAGGYAIHRSLDRTGRPIGDI